MNSILQILVDYAGTGFYCVLYVLALCYTARFEKEKAKRILFVWLPLLCIVVFLLPPVFELYSEIDGSDTYYRILWMLPMSLTIAWTLMRFFKDNVGTGIIVSCAIMLLCGQYTYSNENILDAENRLHLPQMVLNISDFIMNETGGERTVAAMPAGLVQFVRQYNAQIVMPYGREMLMANYYNPVYEAMEETDPVVAQTLCEALDSYDCEFLVIETTKVLDMDGNLIDYGLTYLADVDGYSIYHCPYAQETWEE